MILQSHWRLTQTAFVLFVALTAAGCQGVAGRHGSTTSLMQTVPGEIARERHAHVIAASDKLADVLADKQASLKDMPFDVRLTDGIDASHIAKGESAERVLKRLAQNHILVRGPYQLIQADTWNGRLEYRSVFNDAHLVVTVRAPDPRERKAGHTFIVTDLFGQASLYNLATRQPVQLLAVGQTPKDDNVPQLPITPLAGNSDPDRLTYLNSLPTIEKERADIMAIRTLLMMRMGQQKEGSRLVQQGIVRYPDRPVYFTLASVLFEQAKNNTIDTTNTLPLIMKARFSSAQIRKSRQQVLAFLNQEARI